MGDRLISCPCGQALRVGSDVQRARCPKCSTVLKLRVQPRGGVATQTRSDNRGRSKSRSRPTNMSPPSTRSLVGSTQDAISSKFQCPCGQLVLVPNTGKTVTCPKCSAPILPQSTQRQSEPRTTIGKQPATAPLASPPIPSAGRFQQRSMQSASQGRWSAKQGGESRRPGWWLRARPSIQSRGQRFSGTGLSD